MFRAIRWGVMLWVGLGLPAGVWADTLNLANGQTLEGIIVQETRTHVKIQIAWQGYTTFERQAIAKIRKGNAQDRQRLLARWREEFQADQARDQAQRNTDGEHRTRGLVQYRGQWVTPEQRAAIEQRRQEEQAAQKQQQLEAELERQAQRLQALEEENQRLKQEVLLARQQPFVIVSEPVATPHHRLDLLKDEQGNLIKVQEQNGQKFFITPEGKHVDLQSHDDHLAFTDEHGVHHDLTPRSPER